jgi:predicted O-methyltransferase YrrM
MDKGGHSTNALHDPKVCTILARLHEEDRSQRFWFFKRRIPGLLNLLRGHTPTAAEMGRQYREFCMGIRPDQGRFLYLVGRSLGAHRIVEFGTSFGISTLYLAAAVRDNGGGTVVSAEIEESKVVRARQHMREAGLADWVDIRLGDARETLANPGGIVDMVLLDGWKPLYLPVLEMLTPFLRTGAVVLADNISHFRQALAPYVAHVRNAQNAFESVILPFEGGFEYSVWLGGSVSAS